MNKQEIKEYLIMNYSFEHLAMDVINNILDYADGMEEQEQYNFLCRLLPIPESIIRNVYY